MYTLPMPAAVNRLGGWPMRDLALTMLGVAVPVAGVAIGGYAVRSHLAVRSLPIRFTPDAFPVLSGGWSRPWQTLATDVVSVAGDPGSLDSLVFLSPSAGLLLLGLVAALSLGLIWLGRTLDWGAHPAVRAAWDGSGRSLRGLGTRLGSQVGTQPAGRVARKTPRTLPT